jgi:hypothetical protein
LQGSISGKETISISLESNREKYRFKGNVLVELLVIIIGWILDVYKCIDKVSLTFVDQNELLQS